MGFSENGEHKYFFQMKDISTRGQINTERNTEREREREREKRAASEQAS